MARLKTQIIGCLALLCVIGCARRDSKPDAVYGLPSKTTLSAPKLVPSDKPVILLYEDGFGGLSSRAPAQPIEVAVWGDGRIVWRKDDALLSGRIDSNKVDELLQRLHREGVFGAGTARYTAFGPDAAYDVVEIRLPDRKLWLGSWHEMAEHNANLVATSYGITSVDARGRDAMLAAEPPEYRRFRKIWSDIRTTVKSWTPATGERFSGQVPHGERD